MTIDCINEETSKIELALPLKQNNLISIDRKGLPLH